MSVVSLRQFGYHCVGTIRVVSLSTEMASLCLLEADVDAMETPIPDAERFNDLYNLRVARLCCRALSVMGQQLSDWSLSAFTMEDVPGCPISFFEMLRMANKTDRTSVIKKSLCNALLHTIHVHLANLSTEGIETAEKFVHNEETFWDPYLGY